ncbi:MAG: hypothetical protein JW795_12610 [Chitinivibrionales bacterium]|nr:hypothetical protein [Chitinivibrionales bacterium]
MQHRIRALVIVILLIHIPGYLQTNQNNTFYHKKFDTLTAAGYESALAHALTQEKADKEAIAEEQARIEQIKLQLAQADFSIEAVIQEKYAVLGVSQRDIAAADNVLTSFEQKMDYFIGQDPSILIASESEIGLIHRKCLAFSTKPLSRLWQFKSRVQELLRLIEQVRNQITRAQESNTQTAKVVEEIASSQTSVLEEKSFTTYTPSRGECLYSIAQNPQVYGDGSKWRLIYNANKEVIDKAFREYTKRFGTSKYGRPEDLLFPHQTLKIPR